MNLIKNKNQKGVALVWALVAMLVIILVVTGILMMAQVFHKRENTTILKKQADYYARSGINIMQSQIMSNEVDLSDNVGKTKSYTVEITDNGTVIPVTVELDMTIRSYQINMSATYERNNISATVKAQMIKQKGSWQFEGFYVD